MLKKLSNHVCGKPSTCVPYTKKFHNREVYLCILDDAFPWCLKMFSVMKLKALFFIIQIIWICKLSALSIKSFGD
jgi:hypothetical protein